MTNWTFCRSLHNEILFALWFKATLQNDFVVMKLVLWVIWSPDVELNLLRSPHNEILFALWFKTTLQNVFVVMKLVLSVFSSPDVKLNLLPQSSQWNPTCSLIQNYSSKWLCGDNSSLVSNFKTRCLIEPFAAVFTMKSCLLFDSKLLFKTTLWWWN